MNRNKTEIALILTFIGIITFIWLFGDVLLDLHTKRACRKLKMRKINSVVKEAHRDYSNKGQFTITINHQGKEIKTSSFFLDEDISKFLEKGDSIYKPKGEFKYYIYKNCNPDSLIILSNNINCKQFYE
jgi:hypothetical protein